MSNEGVAVSFPEFPEVSADTLWMIAEQHQFRVRTFSWLPAPQT